MIDSKLVLLRNLNATSYANVSYEEDRSDLNSTLSLSNDASIHSFRDYADDNFAEKNDQMNKVKDLMKANALVPPERVDAEVEWFYHSLGIENLFFIFTPVQKIIDSIQLIYAEKIRTKIIGEKSNIFVEYIENQGDENKFAMFLIDSMPGISTLDSVERRIDNLFLNDDHVINPTSLYRMETYRSKGSLGVDNSTKLRIYFLQKVDFPQIKNQDSLSTAEMQHQFAGETCLDKIATPQFLQRVRPETKKIVEMMIQKAILRKGPVVADLSLPEMSKRGEKRLVIVYRRGENADYFSSGMSDLYHFYDMYSPKKYVESFANNLIVCTIYLKHHHKKNTLSEHDLLNIELLCKKSQLAMEKNFPVFMREVSLLFLLPNISFFRSLFLKKQLSMVEISYAYSGWIFCQHFLNKLGPEYAEIVQLLDDSSDKNTTLKTKLKERLRTDTFTPNYIRETLARYPELVYLIYKNFAQTHHPAMVDPRELEHENLIINSPSFPTSQSNALADPPTPCVSRLSISNIKSLIKKTVSFENEIKIFDCLLLFNQSILKTNLFQPTKVAISFRLDPDLFLNKLEYPVTPYGVFLVVGREFRGFHVRFSDVARGGVRIIRSNNKENYSRNVISLFDENYNLALTQQLKNKDIPEGGSKGTILLSPKYLKVNKIEEIAFKKYVDAILDLLLVGNSPGIKDKIVDLYHEKHQRDEILFLGPDEGTATLMDWACMHAKVRGYPTWKSFTTGKSKTLGGIPHDAYGMTTNSVRQYVEAIFETLSIPSPSAASAASVVSTVASIVPPTTLKETIASLKLGLRDSLTRKASTFGLYEESDNEQLVFVTKFQTGGPDGDLGSNEILHSKEFERYIGIVDGSGVIHDPQGIDKDELVRLATERKMICHFDKSKLSNQGYVVLVADLDVTLPDGEKIDSGLNFRNNYHLHPHSSATLFVPCGGRPSSINANNVHLMFNEKDKPKFKFIVEGANLFFTQQARIRLEKAGVILFKDSSANKGGVTSSSLEVYCGLALADDEHTKLMCNPDSPFYASYVKDVQEIIRKNARNEFNCIWKEHERTGLPRCTLAEELSSTIVKISNELSSSSLWDNLPLRKKILGENLPKTLYAFLQENYKESCPEDVIAERVPESYLKAIFGACLASAYVYNYGLSASPYAFYEYIYSQMQA